MPHLAHRRERRRSDDDAQQEIRQLRARVQVLEERAAAVRAAAACASGPKFPTLVDGARFEYSGCTRNVLRYALSMADGRSIAVAHLPDELLGAGRTAIARPVARNPTDTEARGNDDVALAPESEQLLHTLRKHHWVVTEVARELQLCRATIYRRMKRYGIVPPTQYC